MPTNRRQNGNSVKYPNYIAKLRRKCVRLSKGKHLPNGMLNWRAANNKYMLAIQRFVNNRECAILQSGDSSAFYKYVNNRRVSKDGVSPLFNTDGELSVTEPEKASILNQQFSSVFIDDDRNLPAMDMRTTAELSSITIYPELVRKFTCKLPNKFTRSPDGIPSAVLRSLSFELCTPMYIIFKTPMDSGECPSLWKYADITPVYKKGDASLASNYRPISILPAMCRLFERILSDGINYFMYENRLMSDAQYGFVKGRSTELQLLHCTNSRVKAIDYKRFVDTVYIDFAKAFDTVSHAKLLHKLPIYGITGNILKWFASFLNGRKQRVKIGQSYSDYTNVASGVPQGSCTGPLLLIMYINDLPDYNSDMNTDISLFADDSKISTVLSDVSERSTTQERLNQFMEWADRWQLQIAEHKCCVLTHGSDILPTYNLNGVQLQNVKEFRDLGIIVDADCLFKQHISHICRKAYCSINVIFRCFHTANIAALIISYKSFVRPMLEYCSTVWNPYIPARHYPGS